MKYEDDLLIIYYNECDSRYIEKLVRVFNRRINEILDFFKVKFEDKVVIRLFDNKHRYRKNLEESFRKAGIDRKYHDWMIANTEDGNINMLSLDCVHEIPGFEEYREFDFCMNSCHEFVHLCQQKLNSMNPGWFWEVLATKLGNPECQNESEESFTLEDLENNFDNIDGYGIAFRIANYMFTNYDNEDILSLVKDNGKLYRIIDEVIENINQKML